MSDDSNTQINVAQLLKSPVGAARRYNIEATVPSLGDATRLTSPVVGEVHLTRTSEGILVQGRFVTEVESTCDRCLEAFRYPVEFSVEEQFVPMIDVNTGKFLEILEETDPVVLIDKHHILDLEEVFRQGVYLALPMHPVCRPICKGLCPHCGENLNEGPCDCRNEEADPRWEALRSLL